MKEIINTSNKMTDSIITTLLALLAVMSVSLAHAETFKASFTLLQPILLTESTQMNLGLLRTLDGESCTLSSGGVRSGIACFGEVSGSLAKIEVSGSAGLQVDIDLTGSTTTGLSFVPSMIDNGTGSSALTAVTLQPAHTLLLGGEVSVSELATASSVNYQVNITYQ